MLSTIQEEYNKTQNYPENAFQLLKKALSYNVQLQNDYMSIYEYNSENFDNLFDHIFFFKENETEIPIDYDDDDYEDEIIEFFDQEEEVISRKDEKHEEEEDEENFYTTESLKVKITKQIDEISTKLSISKGLSYLLLKKFNWNQKRLIEKLAEKNELLFSMLKDLHISEIGMKNELCIKKVSNGECPICFSQDVELYQNYCGHSLCIDCWKEEIKVQMNDAKVKITPIHCRFDNCNAEILCSYVLKICGDEIADQYQKCIIENQIYNDIKMIKCPAPKCPNYITINSLGQGNVATCKCGKKICWLCHCDAHPPLKCGKLDEWNHFPDEMREIFNEQQKWIQREIDNFDYRIEHIDEVRAVHEQFLKNLDDEHKEKNDNEINEINNLNTKLKNIGDDNPIFKKFIKFTISQKIIDHEIKVKAREEEKNMIKNELDEFIEKLNISFLCFHQPFEKYSKKIMIDQKQTRERKSEKDNSNENLDINIEETDDLNFITDNSDENLDDNANTNNNVNTNDNANTNNNGNIDQTYKMPPLNCIKANYYNKWKKYYDQYQKVVDNDQWAIIRSHINRQFAYERAKSIFQLEELDEKFNDILSSYDNARMVLMYSYPTAFFLNHNSKEFFIFENILQALHINYNKFEAALYDKSKDLPYGPVIEISERTKVNVNEILNGFSF